MGSGRELAEPKGQISTTREIGVAREGQPDLMRRLRPDPVELERGNQADHGARHSFGSLDEREVLVRLEVSGYVESTSEPTRVPLSDETAKVFTRVTGGHHVAGTKNPEAANKVAGLQDMGASVTL
jgi:hypothetical protein